MTPFCKYLYNTNVYKGCVHEYILSYAVFRSEIALILTEKLETEYDHICHILTKWIGKFLAIAIAIAYWNPQLWALSNNISII